MTPKNDLVFLEHILDSINAIGSFSKGLSVQKLVSNRLRQSAIVREIEIIGEAAKNISSGFKEKHQEVNWKEIVGTRDKIIHHYFGVNMNIIWEIITKDLPVLKKQVKGIIDDLRVV